MSVISLDGPTFDAYCKRLKGGSHTSLRSDKGGTSLSMDDEKGTSRALMSVGKDGTGLLNACRYWSERESALCSADVSR